MASSARFQNAVVGLFGAALIVATLGACTSEKSSDVTATPAASGPPLRIGLQGSLTGSQAELGQGMLRGAELAAEDLTAQGGVLGRPVEIVPIDDRAEPAVAAQVAKAAVTEGLDGVVGPYASGAGAKSLPIYIDAGLVPLRLTSADATAGLGFTLQPMTSQIAPSAVTAITDWAQASSVAILVDRTQDYTRSAAKAMTRLLPASGVEVTAVEGITPGQDSYSDVLDTVLATEPDLLYVVTYYPEAATIAADLSGSDVDCMVDYGGFDNGYISNAGVPAAQACSVVGVPSPGDFPNSSALVDRFEARFDGPPDSWSPYTYDSVLLLADAIERAGSTEANAVTQALAATKGWRGWTGAVAFEKSSGNRVPAPVTVNTVTDEGTFSVDESWVSAVGFGF